MILMNVEPRGTDRTLQRGNQRVAEMYPYHWEGTIMKAASLLAGVGLALAMNRGQTGCSAPELSD